MRQSDLQSGVWDSRSVALGLEGIKHRVLRCGVWDLRFLAEGLGSINIGFEVWGLGFWGWDIGPRR